MANLRKNRRTGGTFNLENAHSAQDLERGPVNLSWSPAVDNFGESGRRWILYNTVGDQAVEEITIEDPGEDNHMYEIVVHDFESGDIETEEWAKTLKSATSKVQKLLRANPTGLYEHDPTWAGQEE